MSRRYREQEGLDESDVPYGPSGPIAPAPAREEVGAR
jgi:hypothetical protein